MEFIYGLLALLFFVVCIVIVVGLIKPKIFVKFLGSHASRGKIFVLGLVLLFILGGMANIVEPESLKQERAVKQDGTQQTLSGQHEPVSRKLTAEEKEVIEKKPIAFTTESRDDNSLEKGMSKVVQEGREGERTFVYKVKYVDDKETKRELISEEVSRSAIAHIVANGTYVKPTPAAIPQPQSTSVYYRNCSAARAAGVTPLYRGQAGYASHLDRDSDGVACE